MNNNKLETIKAPILSGHGTYMYGKLDETDFQLSWVTDQGLKMPHLVKLKFIVMKKAIKDKVGMIWCDQFIKNHQNNYNPEWRRKDKKFNIDTYTKKKSTAKQFTELVMGAPIDKPSTSPIGSKVSIFE